MLRSLASHVLSALRSVWRPDARQDGRADRLTPTYAGDFTGTAKVTYTPDPDGLPDPGEIVWTWVPFEEDHSLGKDRPVLIVSQHGSALLCLMLTSRDHAGRVRENDYIDIGTGSWDPRRRPSEVKLDRVLQIDPGAVRRGGAILERERFDLVAASLRQRGWR